MIAVVDGTMGSLVKEITALKTRVDTVCNKLDEISKFQKDFIDRFARIEERVSFLGDLKSVIKDLEDAINACVTEEDLKSVKDEQKEMRKDITILKEFKKHVEDKMSFESVTRSNLKIALISALAGGCAALGLDLFRMMIAHIVGG